VRVCREEINYEIIIFITETECAPDGIITTSGRLINGGVVDTEQLCDVEHELLNYIIIAQH